MIRKCILFALSSLNVMCIGQLNIVGADNKVVDKRLLLISKPNAERHIVQFGWLPDGGVIFDERIAGPSEWQHRCTLSGISDHKTCTRIPIDSPFGVLSGNGGLALCEQVPDDWDNWSHTKVNIRQNSSRKLVRAGQAVVCSIKIWMSDNVSWAELVDTRFTSSERVIGDETLSRLIIHPLNPAMSDKTVPIPINAALNRLIGYRSDFRNIGNNIFVCAYYPSQKFINVASWNYSNPTNLGTLVNLPLPVKGRVVGAVINPNCTVVAVGIDREPTDRHTSHSSKNLQEQSAQTHIVELWILSLNGAGNQLLGSISRRTDVNGDPSIGNIMWKPDSAAVAFLYENAIWQMQLLGAKRP